jgi:hypothetical protein
MKGLYAFVRSRLVFSWSFFPDISYYEQELIIANMQMKAAERRYLSVQMARSEKVEQSFEVYCELKDIRKLTREYRSKIRNPKYDGTEYLEELRQELNGLDINENQLSQNLAQILEDLNKLFHEERNARSMEIDLSKKYFDTRNQLKVCRELGAYSFQSTISGDKLM